MIYCETIKSSKTYTPPKSGIYKIICVGGGGAGYADTNNAITSEAGKTTSFGTHISANGGASGENVVKLNGTGTANSLQSNEKGGFDSGKNGFDGACVYGASSGAAIGYGYGASGGAYAANNTKYISGQAGDVVSTIVELDPSASIACTIGAGGKGGAGSNAYAWGGADGAIIVQYLGESM